MLAVLAELTRTTPSTPEAASTIGTRKAVVPAFAQRTLLDTCISYIATNFSHTQIARACELHEDLRVMILERMRSLQCLSDTSLELLRGSYIRELSLTNCKIVTDLGLARVAECLPLLEKFKITSNRFITLQGAKHILHGCINLKFFGIGFTNIVANTTLKEIDEVLAGSKAELQGLDLRGCTSDYTLESLVSFVKRWQHLKVLDIGWFSHRMTDRMLDMILTYCAEMEDLDISWNTMIGDGALAAVRQHCAGTILKLNLETCTHITSAGVVNLVSACPRLHTLRLKCIEQTDDRVMEAIAQYLPQITVLNIAGCHEVTDDGLQVVLRRCPGLARLSLVGLTNLTDKAVTSLLQHGENLQQVDLANTPGISPGARDKVKHLDVSTHSVQQLRW